MHELSLAHSLVEVVCEALPSAGGGQVRAVYLKVGELAGVVPEAITFCYELVTRGTPLEGSRLVVRAVPVVIHCATCDRPVALPGVQSFRCPVCGDLGAGLLQGKELEVESIEIEDDDNTTATARPENPP